MKDETMPLNERIEAAIKRITTGHAAMRVPAEATDPDLVLSDCAARIADLEAMLREAGEPLEKRLQALESVGRRLSEIFHHEHRSVTILDMDALDDALGITRQEVRDKYPALWDEHDARIRREALEQAWERVEVYRRVVSKRYPELCWWDSAYNMNELKAVLLDGTAPPVSEGKEGQDA